MPKILSYYGSRNHARARFRIRQQRDRFFSTIAIAKVVETLARKRRVVYVPEYNTTKRCSYCKSPDAVTKGAKSDQTRVRMPRLASSMRTVFDACSLPSAMGVQGLWMRTSQTAS